MQGLLGESYKLSSVLNLYQSANRFTDLAGGWGIP